MNPLYLILIGLLLVLSGSFWVHRHHRKQRPLEEAIRNPDLDGFKPVNDE